MSETIHDAVRATLDAIKVQHGGSLPDGLEIRHTSVFVGNSAPYNIGLWCHRCQEYVRQWCMSDDELKALPGLVSVQVDYHTCWRPSPAAMWGTATEATDTLAGTEGTDDPKALENNTITVEFKGVSADLADYLRENVRPLPKPAARGAAESRDAQLAEDVAVLAEVGRMYLDALDADPEHEYLTLSEAFLVTRIREAVERQEARGQR